MFCSWGALLRRRFCPLRCMQVPDVFASAAVQVARHPSANAVPLQSATSAPLIERSIERATGIVFNITGGRDLTIQEVRCGHIGAATVSISHLKRARVVLGYRMSCLGSSKGMCCRVCHTGFLAAAALSSHSNACAARLQRPTSAAAR